MMEIGRLCIKIAGRDAGKRCIIINQLDDNFVMIDGETRRRKCNIKHLEPLDKIIKLKKEASYEEIIEELEKEGIKIKKIIKQEKEKEKTGKPKKLSKKN